MRTPRCPRAAVDAVVIGATVGAPAVAAGEVVLRRDGSKAVEAPRAVDRLAQRRAELPPAPIRADEADRFQLDDAGVGAAGMLVLALVTAGAISLRGRRSRAVVTGRSTP